MLHGDDCGMSSIGARIRKRRQVLGMKQHELAAAVGVDRSAVSNWERGRHLPQRYQGKLEDVLGISLDDEAENALSPAARAVLRRELGADAERVIRYAEQIAAGRQELPSSPPRERGLA